MQKYLLFIGGIFNEHAMLNSKAISPAANRWQKGLIKAINHQKLATVLLSHFPEPIWPRGHYRPGNQDDLDSMFDSHLVNYWNLPFLRGRSLSNAYVNAFRKICKKNKRPLAVITYNPSPHAVAVGLYAQKYYQIPWIDICADHYDPGPNWSKYSLDAKMAKGHVFLSYHAFQDCPFSIKLHLDGGVNDLKFKLEIQPKKNSKKQKIIVYTGMLTKWGGIILLLKAFKKIKDPNIQLWVCGHGNSSELELALKEDPRIYFFGFVSELRLKEIYQHASIFVNPRPRILDNNMNFPSKILEYLSYGKPVISTWTAGLSPKYRDILEVIDEETEDCLANKIEYTLNFSNEEQIRKFSEIKEFLLEEKTWIAQAKKLIFWLDNYILS